jgi:hypothetical protein
MTGALMPKRSCGSCAHWCRAVSTAAHESGTVESQCSLVKPPFKAKPTHYDNGWRRGSDSCGEWKSQIYPLKQGDA